MTGPNVTQLQQRCADIGECSLPCLDNTGRPRDCFNRTECETSGGYCTDLGLFWHDPGTGQPPFDPGACVLPRGPLEPCGETY